LPKLSKLPRVPKQDRFNVGDFAHLGTSGNSRLPEPPWSSLRLRDRIAPGVRVLFVGINPGVRSAITGHHFAGFSNRFWKLLTESRLVPEPITFEHDDRLPVWGLGITNLIARPTPGINDLKPAEYVAGWKILEKKVAKYRPGVVALVGVTVYRAVLPLIEPAAAVGQPAGRRRRGVEPPKSILGLRRETIHGAHLFVLPNPSGRNANFSYAEMLAAFRALKRFTRPRPDR
jgi:TDG/mug DNA glycosylase family protein